MGYCVKWGDGCIDLEARAGELAITFSNTKITLRPRIIIVEGSDVDYEEGSSGKSVKKKYIYIHVRECLKPLPAQGKYISTVLYDKYEIRYQKLGFGEYLTIVTPGEYLYDYIIVTEDTITIGMSGKREAYFYKEDKRLTIYFV